jgi:hypothetical protein
MMFYEWIDKSDKDEYKKCYTFVVHTLCTMSLINKIKICYEIFRGLSYSRSVTPGKYWDKEQV